MEQFLIKVPCGYRSKIITMYENVCKLRKELGLKDNLGLDFFLGHIICSYLDNFEALSK